MRAEEQLRHDPGLALVDERVAPSRSGPGVQARLLVGSLPEALKDAEVIVVGTDDPEIDQVPGMLRQGQVLIDLFGRLAADGKTRPEGICW